MLTCFNCLFSDWYNTKWRRGLVNNFKKKTLITKCPTILTVNKVCETIISFICFQILLNLFY